MAKRNEMDEMRVNMVAMQKSIEDLGNMIKTLIMLMPENLMPQRAPFNNERMNQLYEEDWYEEEPQPVRQNIEVPTTAPRPPLNVEQPATDKYKTLQDQIEELKQTVSRSKESGAKLDKERRMAPPIVSIEDINPSAKCYTIEVIVLEKGMQRTTSKMSRSYQRIVLQDVEGNKIQGTIFGEDITTLENTLRVHSTYAISNASVDKVDIQHRIVAHKFQLIITARTPIEAKQIEGLTIRTLDFNFTTLIDIQNTLDGDQKIDALFAILNVGPCKKVKNSSVVDMRIIDQGLNPQLLL
ncbi:hypothetical protein Vadar_034691 [Vaccinium darrowii]|uniref:Uncharacterized protein n=1 Tax=Vaccinium darrowii TaxID=229202 RepID=A0ACB7ZPJ1_9ERIC|nr:hypothetical protein Vadar_034691 [Vaccinium darrowii]